MKICGCLLLAVISCCVAVSLRDTAATEEWCTFGEPYIMQFGYKGPRDGVTYHFTKDGKPVEVDRRRIFQRRGRMSFVEIADTDAGEYQLQVSGKGVHFIKKIKLLGM